MSNDRRRGPTRGYLTAELAVAAAAAGADFAIAAKRNTAMWRAAAGIAEEVWTDAIGMHGAQIAACDYAPAGWPPDSYTIVRRVLAAADDISADPRARRRRTIDKTQLALVLDGMWSALLAGDLSTLLQALTQLDTDGRGRAHGDRCATSCCASRPACSSTPAASRCDLPPDTNC